MLQIMTVFRRRGWCGSGDTGSDHAGPLSAKPRCLPRTSCAAIANVRRVGGGPFAGLVADQRPGPICDLAGSRDAHARSDPAGVRGGLAGEIGESGEIVSRSDPPGRVGNAIQLRSIALANICKCAGRQVCQGVRVHGCEVANHGGSGA